MAKKQLELYFVILSETGLFCVRKELLPGDELLDGPFNDYFEACDRREELHKESL